MNILLDLSLAFLVVTSIFLTDALLIFSSIEIFKFLIQTGDKEIDYGGSEFYQENWRKNETHA